MMGHRSWSTGPRKIPYVTIHEAGGGLEKPLKVVNTTLCLSKSVEQGKEQGTAVLGSPTATKWASLSMAATPSSFQANPRSGPSGELMATILDCPLLHCITFISLLAGLMTARAVRKQQR